MSGSKCQSTDLVPKVRVALRDFSMFAADITLHGSMTRHSMP